MRMHFVVSLPESYCEGRYRLVPEIAEQSYAMQRDFLLDGYRRGLGILADGVARSGIPVGVSVSGSQGITGDVIAAQINASDASVVITENPTTVTPRQLETIRSGNRKIACFFTGGIHDLSLFDLVFVCSVDHRTAAYLRGARNVEVVAPFVNAAYFGRPEGQGESPDLLFEGRVTPFSEERIAILTALGKAPLGWGGEFSITHGGEFVQREYLPVALTMYHGGPLWGGARVDAVCGVKVVLYLREETDTTLAEILSPFDSVASGAVLLCQHGSIPSRWLKSDEYFEFFAPGDVTEVLYSILNDSSGGAAVSKKAKERLMKNHSVSDACEVVCNACSKVLG